jgi:hypothetical protein
MEQCRYGTDHVVRFAMDHRSSIASAMLHLARLSGDSQTEREGEGDETSGKEISFHCFSFLSFVSPDRRTFSAMSYYAIAAPW